jgi:hypothetical protein
MSMLDFHSLQPWWRLKRLSKDDEGLIQCQSILFPFLHDMTVAVLVAVKFSKLEYHKSKRIQSYLINVM